MEKNEVIKGIFSFDFDGTVINNTPIGIEKTKRALERFGLNPELPEFYEAIRENYGAPINDFLGAVFKAVGGRPNDSGAYLEFKDILKCLNEEMDITLSVDYPLLKAIECLSSFNFTTALITNRKRACLQRTCQTLNFDLNIFNYIQTADDCPVVKPDGRVFRPLFKQASEKKIDSGNIFYFGDTLRFDYAAIEDSHLPINFVGIASGVNTVEEFKAAGIKEDRIISSFEKTQSFIFNLIEKLEKKDRA